MLSLRPYQQRMVDEIRVQYQLGKKSVLAVLSTGGGKTRIFSHIAEQAAKRGNRVCVLVHRAELLDQASRSMPVHHGLIAAGRSMDLSHAVQIASVQTLARRLRLIPRDFFQLLIIDEAHHTTAGTWAKVLEYFNTARLLGVTATPIRCDGRGLGENYESMVLGPSAKWLTEQGFLADAKVLAPPGIQTKGLRKRMGDFDMKQAEGLLQEGQAMGDCLTHYRQHLDGQTAIAFCCSVAHAEAVAGLFMANGISAASIDGKMDAMRRRALLTSLGRGEIKVLTSCSLIGEGVDVPSVGGCILLRPTQSTALHLQMIGRCLRPSPGKDKAVVLDHVGNTLRLGHHLEEREWTLDGEQKRKREKITSVKVCPKCFAACSSRASRCEECGHEFAPERRELETVDGELVEYCAFKPGDMVLHEPSGSTWFFGALEPRQYDSSRKRCNLFKRKDHSLKTEFSHNESMHLHDDDLILTCPVAEIAKPNLRREQGQAQSIEQLIELGRSRGYKNPVGWARRVMAGRGKRN